MQAKVSPAKMRKRSANSHPLLQASPKEAQSRGKPAEGTGMDAKVSPAKIRKRVSAKALPALTSFVPEMLKSKFASLPDPDAFGAAHPSHSIMLVRLLCMIGPQWVS